MGNTKPAESKSPYLTQTAYISAIFNEAPENCQSSYSILKTYFFTKCYFASVHAAFYFRHLKLQNIPMISLNQAWNGKHCQQVPAEST